MSTKLKSPSKAVPVAESTAQAASSSGSSSSSSKSSSSGSTSKTTTKVVTQVVKEPVVIEVPTGYSVTEAPQIQAQEIASPNIEKIDKVDIAERKAQLAEQTQALKNQAAAECRGQSGHNRQSNALSRCYPECSDVVRNGDDSHGLSQL